MQKSRNWVGINSTKLDVSRFLLILIVVSSLTLAIPNLLRTYKEGEGLIGDQSYLYVRLAEYVVANNQFPDYDQLSFQGRPFKYSPGWIFLLASLHSLVGLSIIALSKILPVIFGMLTIISLFLLLKRFRLLDSQIISAVIIFLLSAPFIYISSISSPLVVVILLSILGFYFFSFHSKIGLVLSVFCFSLIPFFMLLYGFIIMALLLIYVLIIDRRQLKKALVIFSFFLLIYSYFIIFLGPINISDFNVNETIEFPIAEFGAAYGISLFGLILSLFGLYKLYFKKQVKIFLYLLLPILLFLSVKYLELVPLVNILVSVLAGIGFVNLYKMKWESQLIKKVTLVVLVISIVASSLIYVNRLTTINPSVGLIDGVNYLERIGGPTDTVFAHYSLGYYINYAGKKDVTDSYFLYAPNFKKRVYDSNRFFYSEDVALIDKFIKDYSIDYVLFDKDTYNLIYGEKDRNRYLPFFLSNYKRFKLVFNNTEVSIWKVYP